MIGGGGAEVIVMPVVYHCGTVSVSSLGSFLSVGSSPKPSRPFLPLSWSTPYSKLFQEEEGGGIK